MPVPAFSVDETVEVYNAEYKVFLKGDVKEVLERSPENEYKVELYARAVKVTQ